MILNKDIFPVYFKNIDEAMEEVREWLTFNPQP
jgi:hypothetical protein